MNNVRYLSYILIVFIITSCKVNAEEKVEKKNNPIYTMNYDSAIKYPYWRGGRALSIHIGEKYNTDQLTQIADSIVINDGNRHEIININFFYYSNLSNQLASTESCFYATSFYNNGNISTTFNEISSDSKTGLEEEFLGQWREPVLNATIFIYKLSDKHYLEYWYGFGAEIIREIEPNKQKGKNTFSFVDDKSEFYEIKKNGLNLYNTYTNEKIAYYSVSD